MQKYDFVHGRGHGHKTEIAINTDDFSVNAAYIPIAVKSKAFTIRLWYGDVALVLHYDR